MDRENDRVDELFQVGFGSMPEPNDPVTFDKSISDGIDQANSHIQEAREILLTPIAEGFLEAKQYIQNCRDCVEGSIANGIEAAAKILAKYHSKSLANIQAGIADANRHLQIADGIATQVLRAEYPEDFGADVSHIENGQPVDMSESLRLAEQYGNEYRNGEIRNETNANTSAMGAAPDSLYCRLHPNDPLCANSPTLPVDSTVTTGGNPTITTGTGNGKCPPLSVVYCDQAIETKVGLSPCDLSRLGDVPWQDVVGALPGDKCQLDQLGRMQCYQPPNGQIRTNQSCLITDTGAGSGTTSTGTGNNSGNNAGNCCCPTSVTPAFPATPIPTKIDPSETDKQKSCGDAKTLSTKLYSLPENAGDSASFSDGELTFSTSGVVNYANDNGLYAGILGTNVGTPFDLSGNEWKLGTVATEDGSTNWLYQNLLTGEQIESKDKLFNSKIQFGDTSTKCKANTDNIRENKPSGADYCNRSHCDKIESQFEAKPFGETDSFDYWITNIKDGIGGEVKSSGHWYSPVANAMSEFWVVVITTVIAVPATTIKIIFKIIPTPLGCENVPYVSSSLLIGLLSFAGRWLGIVPISLVGYWTYLHNYSCQWLIPTVDQANKMRMMDRITESEYECLLKLNATCSDWQKPLMKANRPTPTFAQAYNLFKGGFISEADYKQLARNTGIDTDDNFDRWEKLAEWLPTPQDIIHMMVRDAADEDIAKAAGWDEEFPQKFAGELKKWAERQGISEQKMKMIWRAHFVNPSVTAINEWLHRLRSGAEVKNSKGELLEFTVEQARKLYQLADVSPGLIDYYIATSYRPMGRIDIRRSYEVGAIDEPKLIPLYRDLGYSEQTAKDMAEYTKIVSGPARAKIAGRPTRSEITKLFVDGIIDKEQFEFNLRAIGYDQDTVDTSIQTATYKQIVGDRTVRAKALRKLYLSGGLNREGYRDRLARIGIDPERTQQIAERDQDVRDARFKPITMAKMCKLVSQGYMNMSDYYDRAVNLGYSPEDATMMVNSCQTDVQEAIQRRNKSEQEKAESKAIRDMNLAVKLQKDRDREAKKKFPCKLKTKPDCPPGVIPPGD